MKAWLKLASTVAGLSCVACANQGGAGGSEPAPGAAATLRDASGATKAEARLAESSEGVTIRLQATGMNPGSYGFHVHAVGRCDPPDFTSAGPHWNPTSRQHGKENPQGMHLGDLPNLSIASDGTGSLDATIMGATLRGGANAVLDADGAALMIHAGPDDYRTDPSGESGARVACGVVS